jgi:Protein of unknown function (DUF5661)
MAKKALDVKTPSVEDIAKKWKLNIPTVKKAIRSGKGVEKEHTTDKKKAAEIARDHLGERPDYYKKLHKLEKSKITEAGLVGMAKAVAKDIGKETKPHMALGTAEKAVHSGDHGHGEEGHPASSWASQKAKNFVKGAAEIAVPGISKAVNQARKGEYGDALNTAGTGVVRSAIGMATKGASEVLAPTPANAGENEFARQAKVKGGQTQTSTHEERLAELTTKFLKNYTKAAHKKWDEMSDEERNSRKGKHMVKGVDVANRHISKGGHIREEKQMNDKVKGLIRESIDNVQAKKLTKLQENINAALALKVAARLEEAKADIAKTYFAK